jgi:hypothetical protein
MKPVLNESGSRREATVEAKYILLGSHFFYRFFFFSILFLAAVCCATPQKKLFSSRFQGMFLKKL